MTASDAMFLILIGAMIVIGLVTWYEIKRDNKK